MRPPALRIVFFAANPTNTEWLRLDREVKEIEARLRDSAHRDSIALESCWATTASDLQRILLDRAPHIIHFSGHGHPDGLALEAGGGVGLASPAALADLLRIVNRDVRRVRAVILNACHSSSQLDPLCEFVDCVVAMNEAIADDAGIAFSAALYQAIGMGRSMQDAFALAQNRLRIEAPRYAHCPQFRDRPGDPPLLLLPQSGSQLDGASGRWLVGHNFKAGDALADGRFVFEEWLGQGTFATVWRARETSTGRPVALKILQERYSGDMIIQERFFRGARLMSQFRHPAVVQVLDPSVVWHGYRFFVMEYVRGRTLMEYALEHRTPWSVLVGLGLEIGEALAYAHERSCIHRDVKPANILIDEHGHARLIDFDLVRDMYVEGGTRPGTMGTIAFAAPETLDRPQDADGRADEYSLAMTLACAIAGREPNRQDKRDPRAFIAQLACPREVRDVLRRAVSWEAHDRYSSMRGFCAALRDAVAAHALRLRRRTLALKTAWMSATGLSLGLGVGYAIWLAVPSESARAEEPATTTHTPVVQPRADSKVGLPQPPGDNTDGLDAALHIDHSATRYSIRITADNRLSEAREHARMVLANSRFRPWIVHNGATGLYYVYVGDYSSLAAAEAEEDEARPVRGKGAIAQAMPCSALRLDPAGYHHCE